MSTQTQTQSPIQKMIAVASRNSTPILLGSLAILDRQPKLDEHERMTYAAICEALEIRHQITDELNELVDDERPWGAVIAGILAGRA